MIISFDLILYLLIKKTLKKITVCEVSNKNHSYLDLVRTPKMRKIVFFSGIFWYVRSFFVVHCDKSQKL